MPDAVVPEQELLFQLLGGFTRARWLFVSCLGLAVIVGAQLLDLTFPVQPIAAVAVAIFSYNVLFSLYHALRRRKPAPHLTLSRVEAILQIGLDLLALTTLVHYLGGAESPFAVLYLIHAIAGSMLLSRRDAWLVAAAAFVLFVAVVALEHSGALPHHHPSGLFEVARPLPYEAAVCLAFLVTLFSSVTITTWTMSALRLRERQLVQIQQILVKNSADLAQACARLAQNQEVLLQTEKQASLGRLVAGIAHEINNPIQFIHGNMAVLAESFQDALPVLDERAAADPGLRLARLDYPFFRKQIPVLLKDMADGASRIRAIVRDLKTFARRDGDQLDETVDLAETIRTAVRLLHSPLKHLAVEVDLEAGLPTLRGNLTQLQQVVVNALQNACQAFPTDGTGTLRVRARSEQAARWVRISVADDGCGIPPEIRDRIFDPFFTTKQRSGGTGLGLAISQGIVQRHHGRIEVESEVGKGTTFHFLLPVAREAAP